MGSYLSRLWEKMESCDDPRKVIEIVMKGSLSLSYELKDHHNAAEFLMGGWNKLQSLGSRNLKPIFLERIYSLENFQKLMNQDFFRTWLNELEESTPTKETEIDGDLEVETTSENMDSNWIKTRELAPPKRILVKRKEGENYEDFVFRALSDVPDGQNKFKVGGRNILASWIIDNPNRADKEGIPNASEMGLKFNNKKNSIVTLVLDGKISVDDIEIGSGEEFEDGIVNEENDNSKGQ